MRARQAAAVDREKTAKKRSWKFTTIEHVEHTFYIIFRDSNVSNSKHIFFFWDEQTATSSSDVIRCWLALNTSISTD